MGVCGSNSENNLNNKNKTPKKEVNVTKTNDLNSQVKNTQPEEKKEDKLSNKKVIQNPNFTPNPNFTKAPNNNNIKNDQTPKKLFLICPDCKSRIPHIINIFEDEELNQIKIKYKCICEEKEKENLIEKMINDTIPENLCPSHQSILNLYCKTCKFNICNNCKNEEHNYHIIKNHQVFTTDDIENLQRNLSFKQIEFEGNCNLSEKEFDHKIDETINQLNELRNEYKKQFENERKKKKELFQMINSILLEYKDNIKNDNNNNNVYSNIIKYLEMTKNKESNNQMATNIEEITPKIPKEKMPLFLKYKFNFLKSKNEKTKEYKLIEELHDHKDKIVTLIELSNNNLCSGSYDKTIKIWDIKTKECITTINESGYVLCLLEFLPNQILSGTSDNNIKLYNINSEEDPYIFEGHNLWVNCLVKCSETKFASGSNDSKIKIWNIKSKQLLSTLEGHNDCILTMILLSDNNLCSGAADMNIKIWDWQNYECLNTFKAHDKWVKCLCQLNNGIIVSGSDDKKIKFWNNDKCIKILEGHNHSVRTICQISENRIATGSFDNTIKIWDINNYECVQTLEGHTSNVIGVIKLKNGKLASCSNDHTIKIWN